MNDHAPRLPWRVRRAGLASAVLLASLLQATWTRQAQAHVVVTPTQSARGAAETYVVTVPSERPVATTALALRVPPGMAVYQFGPLPTGWTYSLREDPQGNVTEIDWAGGSILPSQFAQLSFMARNPATGRQLAWDATQTYADGMRFRWSGPQGSQQPGSFTVLGAASGAAQGGGSADSSGQSSIGAVALAVSSLALALSLLANWLLIALLRRKVL
jgi:uncharacterized protein YcnI